MLGKVFYSGMPESMEEEEFKTIEQEANELATDTTTNVEVQKLQKVRWNDLTRTKCKTIYLLVSYNL